MDKSVSQITVWHDSAEPCDAKTMTLGTDLSIHTSHMSDSYSMMQRESVKLKESVKNAKMEPRDHYQSLNSLRSLALLATNS